MGKVHLKEKVKLTDIPTTDIKYDLEMNASWCRPCPNNCNCKTVDESTDSADNVIISGPISNLFYATTTQCNICRSFSTE